MMSGGDHEHSARTRRTGLQYLFTAKHHGGGTSHDARWEPSLSEDDEFDVFDGADWHEIIDAKGNLYGLLRDRESGALRVIGTRSQQVAKFPFANAGQPWHGYPLIPVETRKVATTLRPVPPEVWNRLLGENRENAQLLTPEEARNLKKGKMG